VIPSDGDLPLAPPMVPACAVVRPSSTDRPSISVLTRSIARHEIDVTAVAAKARFTQQIGVQTSCIAYQPSATADMTDATLLPFDLVSCPAQETQSDLAAATNPRTAVCC
jgi:hypothetical protein